jgi:hypothetical protein
MHEEFYRYSLPSGAEIEIQNLPTALRGTRDVARSEDNGGPTRFEKAIEPLGELCELLLAKLTTAASVPNVISLEFSVALKGKTNLILVSADSEATMKITLQWTKPA